MTKFHYKHLLFKATAVSLSFFWLSFTNIAIAGICDISGGTGIGGTGSPMHGSGIGGTGQIAHDNGSGIGGTGQVAHSNGSGIGGTGKPIQKNGSRNFGPGFISNNGIGGTGQPVQQAGFVIGTITGFGSICVNGIEIHYTSSTPVQRDGQHVNPENSFAIGQVIAANVSGLGNEVTANNMHILHAASGPVSMISIERGEIELLGQKVRLDFDANRLNKLNTIQVGDYVDISGLRGPNGNIIASRIDEVATHPTTVSVRGPISSISAKGFDIQGIKVNTPLPSGLSVGQEIHVSGQVDTNGFKADNITLSQDRQLSAEVGGLISIEGYIDSTKSLATIEVAGRVIDIPDSLQEETDRISNHQKVIVTGHLLENDVIRLEHILVDGILGDIEKTSHIREIENRHEQDKDQHEPESESHEKPEDGHKESEYEVSEQSEHGHEDHDVAEHEEHEFEAPKIPEHEGPEEHEFEAPEHEGPEEHEFEAPETPEHEGPEEHEFEAPETPEHEGPEEHEFEAPEAPEFEAPEAPEFEAPEVPEFEAPEVPEFEAPEVPEFEAPEVPEFEAPEVPEFEAPEVPEFEAPEVPEFEAPEVPEFEAPEVPEFEAPEVPEFEAPEVPEFEAPEVPEFEAPEI
jgi:uncharacterized protein DUF5666